MKLLIEVYKNMLKRKNIPIHYIVFLIAIFLIWKQEYITKLDTRTWMPKPIQDIMYSLLNELYLNIVWLIVVLITLYSVTLVLIKYTPVFNRLTSKKIELTDNTVLTMNPYSFVSRLMKLVIHLLTTFWIYYFLINVIINKNNFIDNFFNIKEPLQNELIISGNTTETNLILMNILFYLNLIMLLFWIYISLFQLKTPKKTLFIETKKIGMSSSCNKYVKLNMFKKEDGEVTEIAILKDRHSEIPVFYLVKLNTENEKPRTKGENVVPRNIDKNYEVINSSDNLNEIIYHYKSLKKYLYRK